MTAKSATVKNPKVKSDFIRNQLDVIQKQKMTTREHCTYVLENMQDMGRQDVNNGHPKEGRFDDARDIDYFSTYIPKEEKGTGTSQQSVKFYPWRLTWIEDEGTKELIRFHDAEGLIFYPKGYSGRVSYIKHRATDAVWTLEP